MLSIVFMVWFFALRQMFIPINEDFLSKIRPQYRNYGTPVAGTLVFAFGKDRDGDYVKVEIVAFEAEQPISFAWKLRH